MLEQDLLRDLQFNNNLGHLDWKPMNLQVYHGDYIGCNHETDYLLISIRGTKQKDGRFKFSAFVSVKKMSSKFKCWVEIYNTRGGIYNLDLVYTKLHNYIRTDLAFLGIGISKL